MIHPDTELRHINEEIGYGVFATNFLPKGTVVYVQDCLEIAVGPEEFAQLPLPVQEKIEKYSFIDDNGKRIVSWDHAKYVNHCCHPNTMSTGYGFEIAIKDIVSGEQITDEYGMFNLEYEMPLQCVMKNCRRKVSGKDLLNYYKDWDALLKPVLKLFFKVPQPLIQLINTDTIKELMDFAKDEKKYKSVLTLSYKRIPVYSQNGKL